MKVRFSVPDIGEEEIAAVADTLRSGWITTGPKTKALEKALADYCQADRAVCLNSQTACAEMTLRLLGIGPGDEVITSAYTYTATASVIHHVGAKLVLVDIQKDHFEMDYQALAAAITEKTKAILPIDLAGIPVDYDRILAIVEEKKALFHPTNPLQEALGRVFVLADTAHSLGGRYKGKPTGSWGDFSSFSFHAVKNFTTAEGGAVTWKSLPGISDDELYQKYMLLSLHGQNKDALSKNKLGSWEYDILFPGYKCNMTDIMASIGLVQLKRYPSILARRRELIKHYDAAFQDLGVQVLDHYNQIHQSSGHLYLVRIPGISEAERSAIIEEMGQAGIACNVHYKPLPMLTAYKNLGFSIQDYPRAFAFYENAISLPLHTVLTDQEQDYVIENFRRIVKERQA